MRNFGASSSSNGEAIGTESVSVVGVIIRSSSIVGVSSPPDDGEVDGDDARCD